MDDETMNQTDHLDHLYHDHDHQQQQRSNHHHDHDH